VVVTVVAIVEAVVTEVATAEVVVTDVEMMGATTIAHHAENIEEAMTVDNHEAVLENLVDGAPKVRVAPVDAEIARGAFI